ncbi:HGGxSTG domain-containing protein [Aminobacter sp. UC22_36]|uniref:HGGxSTG domain-containing protein n=1 Tax=Aminobacter sp. UC22_36 TaxID=3374549 RepID=UPI0037579E85
MHSAHSAPRCGAKSKRSGARCNAPAVRGKRVCRMHGALAGAPRGDAHGRFKHGLYTCEKLASERAIAELLLVSRRGLQDLDHQPPGESH